ncbi:MAG: RraA family protein [Promethearchaeota archaeon]
MEKNKIEPILKEFSKLYTCAVSDAIDELGLDPGFLNYEIRPIWPGARMVGLAGTMKWVKSEKELDRNIVAKLVKFIKLVPSFPIMCVDMSGEMIAAGLGQSTSRMLQKLGFQGGLVDGAVRDIAQVIDIKFPLFARGIVCATVRGRMDVDMDSVMKPIECGGRIINPGDLIFGDINGVVVVRSENIEQVLEKAKEIISTDKWWFEQLEKGRNPSDIEKERPLP